MGLFNIQYGGGPSEEAIIEWTDKIKDLGLAGLRIHTINSENNYYSGQYVKMVADHLYN